MEGNRNASNRRCDVLSDRAVIALIVKISRTNRRSRNFSINASAGCGYRVSLASGVANYDMVASVVKIVVFQNVPQATAEGEEKFTP